MNNTAEKLVVNADTNASFVGSGNYSSLALNWGSSGAAIVSQATQVKSLPTVLAVSSPALAMRSHHIQRRDEADVPEAACVCTSCASPSASSCAHSSFAFLPTEECPVRLMFQCSIWFVCFKRRTPCTGGRTEVRQRERVHSEGHQEPAACSERKGRVIVRRCRHGAE